MYHVTAQCTHLAEAEEDKTVTKILACIVVSYLWKLDQDIPDVFDFEDKGNKSNCE